MHGSMMLKVTGSFDWNRQQTYEAESGYNMLTGPITTYVPLHAGLNTIRFSNPTGPAPNFDKLVLSLGVPSDVTALGNNGYVTVTWKGASDATFNLYRGVVSGGEGSTPLTTGLTNS
jgi:hypothetical protein